MSPDHVFFFFLHENAGMTMLIYSPILLYAMVARGVLSILRSSCVTEYIIALIMRAVLQGKLQPATILAYNER